MSWSTSELRARLAPFEGGTSFVDRPFVFLCLVLLMLSRLFIVALWSSAGKGMTSWFVLVIFIVLLLLSHVVSADRCVLDCIVS